MTRVSSARWVWMLPLSGALLTAATIFAAEEPAPKPQEKAPVKAQEQKPAEPKKEEPKKEETKKEDKKEEPKAQDAKPPDSGAKPAEPKKEDSKPAKEDSKPPAAQPAPAQKAQEKVQEKPPDVKPPENGPPPPKPPTAVPPIIATKLALMADPRLFPYELNVEVSGDTAELSGKVADESEKAAATEITLGLEGIKTVVNNVEVMKDLGRTMAKKKDEIITQYVKDRFGKSKTLETAHFDVKSEDGVVSLSGKTKFLVIVLEAAEAARHVPGVKAVKTDGIRVEGAD